jgi:peptide chain release factor subunit 1
MSFEVSRLSERLTMASTTTISEEEKLEVEQWKLKRILQMLDASDGNGTSMISLIIRTGDQLSLASGLLSEEYGTATNVKSRVNRLSILTAITAAQQRLKLYARTPPNGLVLFCGTAQTTDGKEKKIVLDLEPFKPINVSLYHCGDRFQTEALWALLQVDQKFGFIIVDGNGTLYGTLCGNIRTVLHSFSVDLPKKHRRGGQSSNRFARLRIEARQNYIRKVAELATRQFITDDRANVTGLILAGSAEFKKVLLDSSLFDPRLQAVVIKMVDIAYGGANGFSQAISLAQDVLRGVRFVRERQLLQRFMMELSQDTGKIAYGVKDVMAALEQGAAEDLILFEDLDLEIVRVKEGDAIHTLYERPGQARSMEAKAEVVEREPFLDWISQHFREFGTRLHLVSDKSAEGTQFVAGFGGIGSLLRYRVDFAGFDDGDEANLEETDYGFI